jgi:hypothetical protein
MLYVQAVFVECLVVTNSFVSMGHDTNPGLDDWSGIPFWCFRSRSGFLFGSKPGVELAISFYKLLID